METIRIEVQKATGGYVVAHHRTDDAGVVTEGREILEGQHGTPNIRDRVRRTVGRLMRAWFPDARKADAGTDGDGA